MKKVKVYDFLFFYILKTEVYWSTGLQIKLSDKSVNCIKKSFKRLFFLHKVHSIMFFIELWSGSLKTNMYFMIFTEHGHSILWPWKWVTSTYVLLFKYNCLIEQISTYSEKKVWCTLYALNWNMYMNAMESSMFAKLYKIM